MKIMSYIACSIIFITSHEVLANDLLKDPRSRDEDISATTITVTTNRLGNGLYEYRYHVASSQENKGTIRSLSIDISCDLDFGVVEFHEPIDTLFRPSYSLDNRHVPVQLYGVPRVAGPVTITRGNEASWGLWMEPGAVAVGLRILSPAPPAPRTYKLWPSMDAQGWDYETYRDESPWTDDFMVYGMITGPACALEPPEEPARFPGTSPARTSDELNGLLSYSEPLQDRFHLPAGTLEQAITIHYRDDLDPATFRVEPPQLRGKFHPLPGTSETVILPLGKPRNIIALEAKPQRTPPEKDAEQEEPPGVQKKQSGDNMGWRKDRDVFEIRVDGLPAERKGNKP